jgi:hypothetical protein
MPPPKTPNPTNAYDDARERLRELLLKVAARSNNPRIKAALAKLGDSPKT